MEANHNRQQRRSDDDKQDDDDDVDDNDKQHKTSQYMIHMKKLLFWKKMLCSGNMILCRLAKYCDASIFALAAKFHLEPHDFVRSSITCIKYSFWFYYSKLV